MIHNLANLIGIQVGINVRRLEEIKAKRVIFLVPMFLPSIECCFQKLKTKGVKEIVVYFLLEPPPGSLEKLINPLSFEKWKLLSAIKFSTLQPLASLLAE
jgi:hypothetical protein